MKKKIAISQLGGFIVAVLLVFSVGDAFAATRQEITLPQPNKSLPTTLMQALSNRHSERSFAATPLTDQELSSLLWAANGVNRPDGHRTAPSAINAQDIDIYVCMAEGAYRYDARTNKLMLVSEQDIRPAVAGRQDFVKTAPVSLVLVSDGSKFGPNGAQMMGMADAGYVSQNICLYCSAANLAFVPRATMDAAQLRTALKLTEKQTPMLNNVVGHRVAGK